MGRRRQRVPALAAALLLALAACRHGGKAGAAKDVPAAERPPELRMQGLIVQSWGANGLEWEMRSPVGEGYNKRNIIQVSSMDVQLYDKGEKSTKINADRAVMATSNPGPGDPPIEPLPGVLLSSGDMLLDGHVVMNSTEGTHLQTDWVRYDSRARIVNSSAPVQVERPDSITKGKGLEATADLSKLKIFNQTLVIPDRKDKKK
jgi:hypothetical protein